MKIGSLVTKLPIILKAIGLGKVDIKKELNGLPKVLVDIISASEKDIDSGLTAGMLSVKNPQDELVLIPIGFLVNKDGAEIRQQLEPINITLLIKEVDLNKLAALIDDEDSKLSFVEKLKASKSN